MSKTIETVLQTSGFNSIYKALDTPQNYQSLRNGEVFKIQGVDINPHQLGLAFIALLKTPEIYEREKATILAESGVDPTILGLFCNAIQNGAIEEITQRLQKKETRYMSLEKFKVDTNALSLFLCTVLFLSEFKSYTKSAKWPTSTRFRKVLGMLKPYATDEYKIDMTGRTFAKKPTLGRYVIGEGMFPDGIRELRLGSKPKEVISNIYPNRAQFIRLARSFGLKTDEEVILTEKIERLLADIDNETDYKKLKKLLSQVGRGLLESHTKNPATFVFFKDILAKKGINYKKLKRKKYDKIRKAFKRDEVAVGITRQKVHIKRKDKITEVIQRKYFIRNKPPDIKKALKIIGRLRKQKII